MSKNLWRLLYNYIKLVAKAAVGTKIDSFKKAPLGSLENKLLYEFQEEKNFQSH